MVRTTVILTLLLALSGCGFLVPLNPTTNDIYRAVPDERNTKPYDVEANR